MITHACASRSAGRTRRPTAASSELVPVRSRSPADLSPAPLHPLPEPTPPPRVPRALGLHPPLPAATSGDTGPGFVSAHHVGAGHAVRAAAGRARVRERAGSAVPSPGPGPSPCRLEEAPRPPVSTPSRHTGRALVSTLSPDPRVHTLCFSGKESPPDTSVGLALGSVGS